MVRIRYVRYGSLLAVGLCGSAPQRALVVGLGGGTIVSLLRAVHPQLTVDAVEIDPLVVRVAHRYFGLEEPASLSSPISPAAAPPDGKLVIHTQDGAAYLEGLHQAGSGGLFDVAFVDAYAAGVPEEISDIPAAMRQRHFYEQLRLGLRPGGVAVMNVVLDDEDDELALMEEFADVFSDDQQDVERAMGTGKLEDWPGWRRRLQSLQEAMEAADAAPNNHRRSVFGWGERLLSVITADTRGADGAPAGTDSARLLRWLAQRGDRCVGSMMAQAASSSSSTAEAHHGAGGEDGGGRPARDELRRRQLLAATDDSDSGDGGDGGGDGGDSGDERGCKPGCALLSARRLRQMLLDDDGGDGLAAAAAAAAAAQPAAHPAVAAVGRAPGCWAQACLAVVTPQSRNLLLVGGAGL
eukprot:COSAG01_NODE_5595_length_4158_cov_12.029598_4_plen_410_part_00